MYITFNMNIMIIMTNMFSLSILSKLIVLVQANYSCPNLSSLVTLLFLLYKNFCMILIYVAGLEKRSTQSGRGIL